jgi:hypothetical protein
MFFPDSCEFAMYKFVSGALTDHKSEGLDGKTKKQMIKIKVTRAVAASYMDGPSFELVKGYPTGISKPGYHDAKSWLGWFYAGMVSYRGFAGSAFASDQSSDNVAHWVGASAGIAKPSPGAAYSATYYSYFPESSPFIKGIKNNKCLCNYVRQLSEAPGDKLYILLRKMFFRQ